MYYYLHYNMSDNRTSITIERGSRKLQKLLENRQLVPPFLTYTDSLNLYPDTRLKSGL